MSDKDCSLEYSLACPLSRRKVCSALFVLGVVTLGLAYLHCNPENFAVAQIQSLLRRPRELEEVDSSSANTAVVYMFSNSVPEYKNNLKFFVRWGMREQDGAEYFIVLQGSEGQTLEEYLPDLPNLPSNARYIQHKNECYDWGSFGWLIRSGHLKPERYKYITVLNSSVRGPFIPPYIPESVPWHQLLTQKLTADVKLVGAVISCEPAAYGDDHLKWHQHPHVQSFSVAMEREALEILLATERVLECWSNRFEAIWNAELGSSKAILDAGFNIDCFLGRYQGVDWRNQENWNCNAQANTLLDYNYDGLTLLPYDMMFVKYKDEEFMEGMHDTLQAVRHYESLMEFERAYATRIRQP